jgi:L-alanine-DL-glutamate epimerase-like enolase superfamily enzyme
MINRRAFLQTTAAAVAGAAPSNPRPLEAAPKLRVTEFELLPVRATSRTVWLFVRLRTDAGLTGLGEASDAFGFANTTGEVDWRSDVMMPPERFDRGTLHVPGRPGLGIELNDRVIRAKPSA